MVITKLPSFNFKSTDFATMVGDYSSPITPHRDSTMPILAGGPSDDTFSHNAFDDEDKNYFTILDIAEDDDIEIPNDIAERLAKYTGDDHRAILLMLKEVDDGIIKMDKEEKEELAKLKIECPLLRDIRKRLKKENVPYTELFREDLEPKRKLA